MVTKTKDGWYDTVSIPTGQDIRMPTITGSVPGNGMLRIPLAEPDPEPPPLNRRQRRRAAALRRRRI